MVHESPELLRLTDALCAAGIGPDADIRCGTAAIASPMRLASEWAGFVVVQGGRSWYAKVLRDDVGSLIDTQRTASASEAAAEAGVAPALRFTDTARGVLVFDLMPSEQWRWARVDDLTAPASLDRLLECKRRVHAGKSPGFERSLKGEIEHVRGFCSGDTVVKPQGFTWIDECVEMACDALARTQEDAVPLHGDGVASNVMVGPQGALQLIDFDRGGLGDPWYDVATTLNELFQFELQWRDGITRWAGHCDERDYAKCRLYALIDDWYWTLWGLWMGTASTRRLEFTKLAQWTMLRCRQAVGDSRFESWLRMCGGQHEIAG